jgi:hypothetical protein
MMMVFVCVWSVGKVCDDFFFNISQLCSVVLPFVFLVDFVVEIQEAPDFTLFKSLLDSITDLAQSHLLGLTRNRKRLVDALPRGDNSRPHEVPPPAHRQAAQQQGAAMHIHRTRTTRAPESTSIP